MGCARTPRVNLFSNQITYVLFSRRGCYCMEVLIFRFWQIGRVQIFRSKAHKKRDSSIKVMQSSGLYSQGSYQEMVKFQEHCPTQFWFHLNWSSRKHSSGIRRSSSPTLWNTRYNNNNKKNRRWTIKTIFTRWHLHEIDSLHHRMEWKPYRGGPNFKNSFALLRERGGPSGEKSLPALPINIYIFGIEKLLTHEHVSHRMGARDGFSVGLGGRAQRIVDAFWGTPSFDLCAPLCDPLAYMCARIWA